MQLADRLHPRIELAFGGKSFRLLFPHSALLDIEHATGLNILSGELDPWRLSAQSLRSVLSALTALSPDEIGRRIRLRQVPTIRAAIAAAWEVSMPDPEPPRSRGGSASVSPRRAETWLEAWAIADQDLGLTTEEWLAMTPRMVDALARQRLEQLRQHELMLGMVIANTANFGAHPPRKPLTPREFMLHPWPEEAPDPDELIGDRIMKELARIRQR